MDSQLSEASGLKRSARRSRALPGAALVHRGGRFGEALDLVARWCPIQKRGLAAFLGARDDLFWSRAELCTEQLARFLERSGQPLEAAVEAYAGLCRMMMTKQLKFAETGRYTASSAETAHDTLYQSAERGGS